MTRQTSQNFIRIVNLLVTFYSIKLDFCQFCSITAGCNLNNQLLFTAFCLLSVGWIKAHRVHFLPIVFCPLTVYIMLEFDFFDENDRLVVSHNADRDVWSTCVGTLR